MAANMSTITPIQEMIGATEWPASKIWPWNIWPSPKDKSTEPRPALLRRIEGEQGALHHVGGHPFPAVAHGDPRGGLRRLDLDGDRGARAAGLLGVLDHVDEHLLHLGGIEEALARGAGRRDELRLRVHRAERVDEGAPREALLAGGGHARELRVPLEERLQMIDAVGDGVEDARELRLVGPAFDEQSRRVHQGRHRRERVVQLVAQDANELLPGLDLLSRDLVGQVLHEEQRVRLAAEGHLALREVVGLGLPVVVHGEEVVVSAEERVAQRRRGVLEEREEVRPLRLLPLEEQIARGRVREGDRAAVSVDDHRERRLLDGGADDVHREERVARIRGGRAPDLERGEHDPGRDDRRDERGRDEGGGSPSS
jgi:hypothetical protein